LGGLRIRELPTAGAFAQFREGFGQRFLLTVDTEEAFEWGAPFSRDGHSLTHLPALTRFQQFCESHGVVPIYLIDYAIADSPVARDVLLDAVQAGRAEIGVHLHPWVNPPFEEEVTDYNSFAGNLPAELERAKFMALRDRIEAAFGTAPKIFRCGRYGAGAATARNLIEGGIAIDTSVRSLFDYSYAGGPNYRDHPLHPYWLDRDAPLLELPLTSTYWGPLRQVAPWLYPRLWRAPRLRGMLSHLGLVERIPLTPEGVTVEEAIRGIDMAIDIGLPVLVLSFHSPSVAPGNTTYVRNEAELEKFYDWWSRVLGYLHKRGIAPTTAAEILEAVTLASPPAAG